jgi:hypothetical protein
LQLDQLALVKHFLQIQQDKQATLFQLDNALQVFRADSSDHFRRLLDPVGVDVNDVVS